MPLGTLTTQAGDGIVFEVTDKRVRTWHEARLSSEARWAPHEVHQQQPKQEFLGPGLASLSLAVRLDVERGVNPTDELGILRAIRDTGQVLQFTIGSESGDASELVGDFILKGISEEWRRTDPRGRLIAVTAELALEEYA